MPLFSLLNGKFCKKFGFLAIILLLKRNKSLRRKNYISSGLRNFSYQGYHLPLHLFYNRIQLCLKTSRTGT